MGLRLPVATLLLALACESGEDDPLVVARGEVASVVDGDTIRVRGVEGSIRLLGIDAEETAHDAKEIARLEAMERGAFLRYALERRGDAPRPVKYPTPCGIAATARARELLPAGARVRLERDRPEGPDRDAFGRLLAWVWVLDGDGKDAWLLNERMVREGWSPRYAKYGASARFDDRLRAAEEEARAARRGIWAPGARAYPDYPERLAWWERRARGLARVLRDGDDALVVLGDRAAVRTLLGRVGSTVRVAGVVEDAGGPAWRAHEGGVTLRVGGAEPIEVELVGGALARAFPERRVAGEWIVARGPLDREGSPRAGGHGYLRVVVKDPAQVGLPGEE